MTVFSSFLRGFLGLSAALAVTVPAHAATAEQALTPYVIDYDLYAGGLDVVNVQVVMGVGGGQYTVSATAETDGFWQTLVPWRNEITATGRVDAAGKLHPETARYDTFWRDKPKTVLMTYDKNDRVTTTATPPHKPDGRVEATPEQLQGSLDTLSAVMQVIAKGGAAGCAGEIPAYDGRRLYKLELKNKGTEELAKNRYSIFEGPAVRCEVTFSPVAGFPIKETRAGFWNARDNESKPLIIWIARPSATQPEVPVKLQSTVQLGTLVAHIRSIAPAPVQTAPASGK